MTKFGRPPSRGELARLSPEVRELLTGRDKGIDKGKDKGKTKGTSYNPPVKEKDSSLKTAGCVLGRAESAALL